MEKERYQAIRRVFQHAAELSDAERAAYLDESCGDDAELRTQVERLLAEVSTPTEALVPATPIDLLPFGDVMPATIGPYPIEAEIGRGGMGIVYRATDTKLQRPVALKVLAWSHDDSFVSELQREARLLASLHHPNIVTIYSLESFDDRAFFTLELVNGPTLAQRIADAPLNFDDTHRYLRQVCLALEAAHDNDILHLDLKPSNVMVTGEGLVKVLDFGIARSLTAVAPDQSLAGTLAYMSPERFTGGPIDRQSDTWALGCLAFECLTGTRPFDVTSAAEAADGAIFATPHWDRLPEDTPASLRELIERCLRVDRQERLATIGEAQTLLGRHIGAALFHGTLPIADSREHPLPAPATPFEGREAELAELAALQEQRRLVTVVGTGGVGKTRVALEFAERRKQREGASVCFVELASVRDADLVSRRTAETLGVETRSDRSFLDQIIEALHDRSLLLCFDNCEQVIEAAAQTISAILDAAPDVSIVATSREPLDLPAEVTLSLAPLAMPERDDEPIRTPLPAAVEFFRSCARRSVTSFDVTPANYGAIAQLCRRLDGIPLAIELAAARVRILGADELASRLEQGFGLLKKSSRRGDERQRTLWATIDWSHQLLTDAERVLFRRLSVFVGGWTLTAAEQVLADSDLEAWQLLDLLTGLINKSLVDVIRPTDHVSDIRFRFLESVREYARERFLADEPARALLEDNHGRYYEELLLEANRQFQRPQIREWIVRLDHESPNLTIALDRRKFRGDQQGALSLGAASWRYWEYKGLYKYGLDTLLELLADCPDVPEESSDAARVFSNAHGGAGVMAIKLGKQEVAEEQMLRAAEMARLHGDPVLISGALSNLGVLYKIQRRFEDSIACYLESLEQSRSKNDDFGVSRTLSNLGVVETALGRFEDAARSLSESIEISRRIGDRESVASGLINLGLLHRDLEDLPLARRELEEAYEIYKELGSEQRMSLAVSNLGIILHDLGEDERAIGFYQEALEMEQKFGNPSRIVNISVSLLASQLRLSDIEGARGSLRLCLEQYDAVEDPIIALLILPNAASIALRENDVATASHYLGAADKLGPLHNHTRGVPEERTRKALHAHARELSAETYERCVAEGATWNLPDALKHVRDFL